jgi:hypothetical protein
MTARQAFARHCRDRSFVVLGDNTRFVTVLALGSITGTILGGLLLGVIPDLVLVPVLVAVLLLSAGQGLATPVALALYEHMFDTEVWRSGGPSSSANRPTPGRPDRRSSTTPAPVCGRSSACAARRPRRATVPASGRPGHAVARVPGRAPGAPDAPPLACGCRRTAPTMPRRAAKLRPPRLRQGSAGCWPVGTMGKYGT